MKTVGSGTFKAGNQFGRGRPKGSANKISRPYWEQLDAYGEPILRKLMSQALLGVPTALRLCVERLIPLQRDRCVMLDLSSFTETGDINCALQELVRCIASGRITPGEGESISHTLETCRRIIQDAALATRVTNLERALNDDTAPKIMAMAQQTFSDGPVSTDTLA
jgi:hypothetical protein